MNSIDLTIGVLFYNQEIFVNRCLNSIIDSGIDLNHIEIVIVDDCSIDNTEKSIKEFIKSHQNIVIKYIRNSINSGILVSRKVCIENATKDFFIFVDGDDTFITDALHNFLNSRTLIELTKKYDILDWDLMAIEKPVNFEPINPGFIIDEINITPEKYSEIYTRNRIELTKFVSHIIGKIIRTSLLKKVIVSIPDLYINFFEDYLLVLLMINEHPSIYANTNFYKFYLYNNSNMGQTNTFINSKDIDYFKYCTLTISILNNYPNIDSFYVDMYKKNIVRLFIDKIKSVICNYNNSNTSDNERQEFRKKIYKTLIEIKKIDKSFYNIIIKNLNKRFYK